MMLKPAGGVGVSRRFNDELVDEGIGRVLAELHRNRDH